ncbi:MAG: acyl-ACP--UDP-N-acetylglucosamine O-acyltransferase [Candidatus Solibacter usitatus]|nr:acyl-ACP--UDP-N-acetylglucosamine O-acyltransferase [Candidatus Solibacter usitatus]
MSIHPTALVDAGARIDAEAEIGPYCILGPEVEIGPRTRLMAQVYLEGPTWIGADNLFFPYSTVGVASQDKKYQGERAETRIGSRNTIREFVTIHRGTQGGGRLTRIGDDNLLMAYTHVAHDASIGDGTVLANGVTLAGHVTIGDYATIGAFSGVHQFCRVGRCAIVGGYSVITQDVMPFSSTVSERSNRVFGANKIGLERRGFAPAAIEALQTSFRLLTRAGLNTTQAIERIRAEVAMCAELEELIEFIRGSERGVIK